MIETDQGASFVCPSGVQEGDPVDERCFLTEVTDPTQINDGVSRPMGLPSPGCDRAIEIIQTDCARVNFCHGSTATTPNSFQPNFTGDFTASLIGEGGVGCNGLPFINPADPMNSYILVKVSGTPPQECNARMPFAPGFANVQGPPPPAILPDEDIQCLTDWVMAVATGQP